ncbi:hypothetical protein, partial [Sphingobacterium sp. T2]|uniref:hypothetical protein n=1 Tax=Sphingobacterium sp. T2 TaxID=1590596 RepID=UPI00057BC4B5
MSLFACSKDNHTPPSLNVPEEPEPPTNPITPGRNVVVWVDARSNVFGTYGKFSSKTEIVNILDRLEDCGVTGLVIDVKPSSGYTMYNSAYTKEWTSYDGKTGFHFSF